MSYIYSFFSFLALFPLYMVNKKLTSSYYPITVFYGIVISLSCIFFHVSIFRNHEIPILKMSFPEDECFIDYVALGFAILCNIVMMISHGKDRKE